MKTNIIYILLDTTGSMQSELTVMNREITKLQKIIDENQVDIRLVYFSDYDMPSTVYRSSLGNQLEDFVNHEKNKKTYHGQDTEEAHKTALYNAFLEVLDEDPNIKIDFIFITDAGPHTIYCNTDEAIRERIYFKNINIPFEIQPLLDYILEKRVITIHFLNKRNYIQNNDKINDIKVFRNDLASFPRLCYMAIRTYGLVFTYGIFKMDMLVYFVKNIIGVVDTSDSNIINDLDLILQLNFTTFNIMDIKILNNDSMISYCNANIFNNYCKKLYQHGNIYEIYLMFLCDKYYNGDLFDLTELNNKLNNYFGQNVYNNYFAKYYYKHYYFCLPKPKFTLDIHKTISQSLAYYEEDKMCEYLVFDGTFNKFIQKMNVLLTLSDQCNVLKMIYNFVETLLNNVKIVTATEYNNDMHIVSYCKEKHDILNDLIKFLPHDTNNMSQKSYEKVITAFYFTMKINYELLVNGSIKSNDLRERIKIIKTILNNNGVVRIFDTQVEKQIRLKNLLNADLKIELLFDRKDKITNKEIDEFKETDEFLVKTMNINDFINYYGIVLPELFNDEIQDNNNIQDNVTQDNIYQNDIIQIHKICITNTSNLPTNISEILYNLRTIYFDFSKTNKKINTCCPICCEILDEDLFFDTCDSCKVPICLNCIDSFYGDTIVQHKIVSVRNIYCPFCVTLNYDFSSKLYNQQLIDKISKFEKNFYYAVCSDCGIIDKFIEKNCANEIDIDIKNYDCTSFVCEKCNLVPDWKSIDNSKIYENSKVCPSCNEYIEKLGGCNHISHRTTKCNSDWCWVCRALYVNQKKVCKCN